MSLIDLGLHDQRVYGVTMLTDGLELLSIDGCIMFTGPFTLAWPDGTEVAYDPRNRVKDTSTGKLLDYLVDNRIALATLVPETSILTIELDDGAALHWKPTIGTPLPLRVRLANGREYRGDGAGAMYWCGGPAGEQPTFLSGGPRPGS